MLQVKERPAVVIAGAAGFVGRALINELKPWYRVIGLTRRPVAGTPEQAMPRDTGLVWRQCDLFSLIDAEKGLAGADYAYYLVHSMMPSARLTQGKFQDMDLILADNFARAAARAGVKQIIYLGGLVPQTGDLSLHLQSRLEVEQTLGAHGVPVTALRAGLIIGAGGSTFNMLLHLAQNYKLMVFPRLLKSQTHPIALPDVIEILHYCLGNPITYHESYDIGGPDVLTYEEMVVQIARILGNRCYIKFLPVFPHRLAGLLLSTLTGSPRALVNPLVESLKHPMVAQNRRLQEKMNLPGLPFTEAVKLAIAGKENRGQTAGHVPPSKEKSRVLSVRSVQRLPLPPGKDADWVALYYSRWLPKLFLGTAIKVKVDQHGCYFYFRFLRRSLLDLTFSHARSSKDRPLYYITGGLLARLDMLPHRGRLEFRAVLEDRYVLVAIHDYVPTLPWFVYHTTQALLHVWVMRRYGKHLGKLGNTGNN